MHVRLVIVWMEESCKKGTNMKYSVCVDAVYRGKDFLESLAKCHALGFDCVEFWSWWDKDIDAVSEYIRKNNMTVSTFCTKFISLVDPQCRDAFLEALEQGIFAAEKLGCHQMIVQTGADTGLPREIQMENLRNGLLVSQRLLEEHNFTLLLEPLNTKIDHQGYFIKSSDEMADVLEELNVPCFQMLFDIYHQQISEGDLLRHIEKHFSKIRHIHAAGNPGRHELYRSEINYSYIFEELERMGYEGYVGLEYFPVDEPEKGLEILARSQKN